MNTELLEQIERNTSTKTSTQIEVSENSTKTKMAFNPPILDKINKMEAIVTDQNDKQLNLRGENLTIRYHLR